MTPSLGHCIQSCVFCWRATPEIIGIQWNQTRFNLDEVDEPNFIVRESVRTHRQAIKGFGGNPKVTKEMLEEAMNPIHVAISLEGEPTLYPRLAELVEAYFRYKFRTVFVVTNGLRPDILSKLESEPSQLYVSVCAPDKETYLRTCRPLVSDGWERLMETLELLNSFNCPTVLRHTLLPGFNMHNPRGYAKLAERSNATYIEPKAAMSVGYARKRFGYDVMAWHGDVKDFSTRLASESGYEILDEQPMSLIVLLSRLDKPKKLS